MHDVQVPLQSSLDNIHMMLTRNSASTDTHLASVKGLHHELQALSKEVKSAHTDSKRWNEVHSDAVAAQTKLNDGVAAKLEGIEGTLAKQQHMFDDLQRQQAGQHTSVSAVQKVREKL